MPIQSRWSVPIPRCSLQQWIFGSACGPVSDHKAFIDPDSPETNFLTMSNYRLLAKRIALGLLKRGLKRGDRVLIYSGNSLIYPSVFLGVLMAGGIVSGANPTFVERELVYQLRDSESSFLFVAPGFIKKAMSAANEVGLGWDRIFVLGNDTLPAPQLALFARPGPGEAGRLEGAHHWTELLAKNRLEAVSWSWEEPTDPEKTTCCLNYSSGTTGVPKGVEISHYSYVANGVGVVHMNRLRPDYAEKIKHDSGLAFLPFYHAYGQTYFIATIPHMGIPVYVMPTFQFDTLLRHIERFRVTTLPVVPPIVVLLAKAQETDKYDLSSLENIGSGAAPLAREVCEEVERRLPNKELHVRQGWGMTELTCTAISWDPTSTVRGSGGVGEVSPNCAVKLMTLDGTAEIRAAGERGELWVTGPTLMRRYWRKPAATDETVVVDEDGTRWLKTGDVAYIEKFEPGGIIHVVDRVKELIKVKGNQVAPAELEGLLLECPDVADAAVIGVSIQGEEYPRAYVVRKPGSTATERDVAQWLHGKVAPYKQLRGGVVFVDQVPKNPSGKILRKQLRERARNESGDGIRDTKTKI